MAEKSKQEHTPPNIRLVSARRRLRGVTAMFSRIKSWLPRARLDSRYGIDANVWRRFKKATVESPKEPELPSGNRPLLS
jgi:hypothetical protein